MGTQATLCITNGGLGDVRGLPEGLFACLHMTTHEGR